MERNFQLERNCFTTTVKTQRNVISATGSVWPAGEIDIVNDRYMQFGVNAIAGTVFDIDSIGLYAGGAGGSGMRFKVYISKDSLFSNPDVTTMISDHGTTANASNTMYAIDLQQTGGTNCGSELVPACVSVVQRHCHG
ncbi:MAG: hypothetical protein QM800_05860 [Paludibacter sp.]